MKTNKLEAFKIKMREAIANYRASEGCSCCEGSDHDEDLEVIAKLLDVPAYEDKSGYDFTQFKTKS